jgi:plastocyanin
MEVRLNWLGPALVVAIVFWGCSGDKKESPPDKSLTPASTGAFEKPQGYQTVAVRDGGTIAGKVIFNGTWKAASIAVSKDKEACGQSQPDPSLVLGSGGGVQGAVVRITDIQSGKSMGPVTPVLDQKGCKYIPHVLAFPVGTTLEILNSDGVLHNVHSFSEKNSPFNRAQPKYRKKITEVFNKKELISLKCDVHSWMNAWIFVSDHPYYAVTGGGGGFQLTDVPPGAYNLEVWHEFLGKQVQRVTVDPNGKAKVDFKFSQKAR